MNATEFRHGTHALWRASDARAARFIAAAALYDAGSPPPPPPPPPAADVPVAAHYEYGTHARAVHHGAQRTTLFRSAAPFVEVPDTLQACVPFMSFQPQQPFQPQPAFKRFFFPRVPSSDQAGRIRLRGVTSAQKIAATEITGRLGLFGASNYLPAGVVVTNVAGRFSLRGSTTASKIVSVEIAGRLSLRAASTGYNPVIPEYDYAGVLRLLGSTTAQAIGKWAEHGKPSGRRPGDRGRRRPRQS